jgi:F-box and leucine-rich repeat protein 2/20
MKLPKLEVLTLVGCNGIDDEALGSVKKDCSKSLQVIILIGHFDFLRKNRPF